MLRNPRRQPIWLFLMSTALAGCATPIVSARTWVVDQRHAAADDTGPGTQEQPFRRIAPAAAAAQPGDTVRVHAGVYRERVAPARGGEPGAPIVYTAAPGEDVTIKGSVVWTPQWQPDAGTAGVFRAELDPALFPEGRNPYRTPLVAPPGGQRLTTGQVFVDGQPLLEVDSTDLLRARPGTWIAVDDGAALLVHFPTDKSPPGVQVELTVRDRVFAPVLRGLDHITVCGFTIEHCANQFPRTFWDRSGEPQAGALGCRGGRHWVIEDNTIRFAKTVGIDCGTEGPNDTEGLGQRQSPRAGDHLIRGNTIVGNGACGIAGYHSYRTRIIGNVVAQNNRLGFMHAEKAGMKFHGFVGGHIEANLVRDNDGPGIWLDNIYRHSRVTRNVVIGNTGVGIFVEMGAGPLLVDNNVVAYTVATQGLAGDGVYAHDASGVTLAHNLLFFNAHFGLWSHVATDRNIPRSLATDAVAAADEVDSAKALSHRASRLRRMLPEAGPEDGYTELRRLLSSATLSWDPSTAIAARPDAVGMGEAFLEAFDRLASDLATQGPTHEEVAASNWWVVNNLFVGNHAGSISLPLEAERSRGNRSDHNAFAGGFDSVTSETSAVELDETTFRINNSKGRIADDALRSFISSRRVDTPSAVPEGVAKSLWPGLTRLSLEQWQSLFQQDEHSTQAVVVRPTLASHALQLRFMLAPGNLPANATAVPGVERDFFGVPIEPGGVVPGPFQSLLFNPALVDRSSWTAYRGPYAAVKNDPAATNEFLLWPIPRVEPDEPRDSP